jgi:hypothetical protein
MRHDRQTILRERAAQARRRAWVAALAAFVTVVAWIVVAVTPAPGLVGALATAGFGGVVVAGARAAGAQRKADEKVLRVAREVEAAATATQALRRVARERAAGVEAAPSDLETQAIKVVTSEDLAPLAAPRPVPAPDLPAFAEPVASEPIASVEDEAAWTPNAVPAPAYTLKPSVKQQLARPLTDDDFAAAERAARAAQDRAATRSNTDAHPTTGALDAILARRRRSA